MDVEYRVEDFTEVLKLLGVLWAVEWLNEKQNRALNNFGILPRTPKGLVGIAASPFLHGSKEHLIANSLPILLFGGALSLYGKKVFWSSTAQIIALGGLGVWGLARQNIHVGASGLAFGYFGHLLAQSYYNKDLLSMGMASFLMWGYQKGLLGALPTTPGTSWEAHTAGLVTGIIAARSQKHKILARSERLRSRSGKFVKAR